MKAVNMVVLDEADRMLDMGFIHDINRILDRVPKNKQISLFSATIDSNVLEICDNYMYRPEEILVSKDEITLKQIEQRYVKVDAKSRYPILMGIIGSKAFKKAIIFTKTRRGAHSLSRKLRRSGLNADALHGDLSQNQRDRVTQEFRENKLDLLVATDIAARGLDINGITHIINYNFPRETLAYFHRIGRTARMEKKGIAITFVAHGEEKALADIKAHTSTKITELKTNIRVKWEAPQKHHAVCSKCKTKFYLPFKPTGRRPVYCIPCLKTRKRRHHRRH